MHRRLREERATKPTHIRRWPCQPRHLVPLSRRHQAPESHHALPRIRLVQLVVHSRTVSTKTRRDLQCHRQLAPLQGTTPKHVLVVELIQRHAANRRLHFLPHLRLSPRPAHTQQLQAPIELVDATLPNHTPVWTELCQLRGALHHTNPLRVQGFHTHHRQHQRQAKTKVHRLEDAVVAPSKRLRIELLQALTHQIHGITITAVFAHLVHRAAQHLTHRLRIAWRLHGVLRDILHDRPDVHHRPPVHIAEVRQEDVRFIPTDELVVAREAHMPLTLALPAHQTRLLQHRAQIVRKPVAAIRTRWLPPRARVLTHHGPLHAMPLVMPPAHVHERGDELPHRAQINFF